MHFWKGHMKLELKGKMSKFKEMKPFKTIIVIVFSLTCISLVAALLLTFFLNNPSQTQISLIETCSTTWKMGFGAILGLLSGRKVIVG